MKKLFILAVITLLFSCNQHTSNNSNKASRTQEITLEDIWGSTFSTNRMNALNSMNGDYYSLLNRDENGFTTVDQYSYLNLEKVATIVDGKTLNNLQKFESYSFNNDESKLILGKDIQKVYRRSTKGTYYVYSVNSKKTHLIGEQIQEPTFSPDSKKVAYAKNNNLFILDLTTNTTKQITKDGKYNHVINGTTDWVYEEEFGFVRAFEWSKDSKFIAFLRFNESKVKEFSMGVTGNQLYPTQHVFKYPKAGEDNAKVSLHTYNLKTRKSKKVALGNYEYIPRIQWSNTNHILIATTLNRHQNDLKLHKINALKNSSSLLLNEKDDAYVSVKNDLTFLQDNSFIWTSEKDGYNHIYHYDFNGKLINQITKGNWEITKYYGFHREKKTIYYQSAENGTINRGVYSIHLDGTTKKLLSNNTGTNTAAFSSNLNYFINTHSSTETPPIYSLYSGEGTMIKVIKDNSNLEDKLLNYKISPKEFSTININGNDLNMWMIKPLDFDEQKKYPLLMFQYSGPGSQQVSNKWNGTNDYWHQLLAQRNDYCLCRWKRNRLKRERL